jgi:hypothetical protein
MPPAYLWRFPYIDDNVLERAQYSTITVGGNRMSQHFVPRADIRAEARDILVRFYESLSAQAGRRLAADEFFPVKVDELIRKTLGWDVEKVARVGATQSHCRISAQFDASLRVIRLGTDDAKSTSEQNFSLAHEVGHVVLHEHLLKGNRVPVHANSLRPGRQQNNELRVEKEANVFAAELLMPEKAVKQQFVRLFEQESLWMGSERVRQVLRALSPDALTSDKGENVAYVSEILAQYQTKDQRSLCTYFGVSTLAMCIKLRELNLLYS